MPENPSQPMTPFDCMTQGDELQILKAAIPFLHSSGQKPLSIYIRFLELQNTLRFFDRSPDELSACSITHTPENPIEILQTIRAYASKKSQGTIDMVINFFQAFQLYHTYKEQPFSLSPMQEFENMKGAFMPNQSGNGNNSIDFEKASRLIALMNQGKTDDVLSELTKNMSPQEKQQFQMLKQAAKNMQSNQQNNP